MSSRTDLVANRLIIFYLLCVVGQSIAALEETQSSSLHMSGLSSILNNLEHEKPADKKTYTYSGYKRLPLYNFGIGKRWADNNNNNNNNNNEDKRTRQYSFGIGKRQRDYRFGLGKRNMGYDSLNLDYFSPDDMDNYYHHSREDNFDDFMEDKRASQPFSFGIGKRAWRLATAGESGKRPNDFIASRYPLGLGKGMNRNEDLDQ